MITKEEALKASKMSLKEMQAEYPKIDMLITYMQKHYPDDFKKLCEVKIVQYILMDTERSNTELEDLIDKIATFNSYTKWMPVRN